MCGSHTPMRHSAVRAQDARRHVPNLRTKIVPAKIPWRKLPGKSHMVLGIPPVTI